MKKMVKLFFALMLILNVSCINKGGKETSKQTDSTMSIKDSVCANDVITDVYEGEVGHDIFYDTPSKKGILFVRDNNYQFTILDKTSDNKWIIVEKAPAIAEEGRTETEHLLFNIPKSKEVSISNIDSNLSPYVIRFEKKDSIEYVVTSTKYGENEVFLPVKYLLPIISLKIGENDDQIGQGVIEKKVNDGDYLYAVPSIAACDGKVYIVDAINFRVIIFDYNGNFIKNIHYPRKSENGKWNVVRDICIGKGVIYLLSSSEESIFVIDTETEDVISIIKGLDTGNKRFGSVNKIALNSKGNLLIPDTWDNSLYTYERIGNEFKLLSRQAYMGENQLINDIEGLNYSIKSDTGNVVIYNSLGKDVGSYTYSMSAGGSTILGVDDNRNIYVRTFESDTPEAQFAQASYIKVISQSGTLLNNFKVAPWSGGSIIRDVSIDEKGNIFLASYYPQIDDLSDKQPNEFNVRMIGR